MVPENLHDFFMTSGGAAAALIGLLFVAVSVAGQRLGGDHAESQMHRIRAAASLGAFTNSLSVSLFALIEGDKIGPTALIVAIGGIIFVVSSTLSLIRLRQVHWRNARDFVFLVGLLVVFITQLLNGWAVTFNRGNSGDIDTIAIMVIVCFLIGISRAWDLIGGPSIMLRQEVTDLVRHRESENEGNQ
jgi:hypothetical protein